MALKPQKPSIVVVCGPTGIGKTTTAITIAEAERGEIIGADSMQIYRYMDIGTAKPTAEERVRAVHHLVDVVDPDEDFDAARFSKMADRVIRNLVAQDVLPVVAGGTGLYIRAQLKKAADESGLEALYRELEKVDPETAARVHRNDRYRVLRALEVYRVTGRAMAQLQADHGFADQKYRCLKIGLTMDREKLYTRIDQRVDAMLEAGLEAEVRQLLDMGYLPALKAMQSIGYRHMAAYINGQVDRDEMVETLKRDTRRYAKRQFTWFRADREIQWFEPGQTDAILELVRRFLEQS